MTEDNEKKLVGYTQAVQDMSEEIKDILETSEMPKAYMEKLESAMRARVLTLVEESTKKVYTGGVIC